MGALVQKVKVSGHTLLILLGFLSFLLLGYYVFNLPMPFGVPQYLNIGAFEMVDQEGRLITRDDLIGKPFVLLFGSTGCTDTCEARLAQMSAVLQKMDTTGSERLRVVFVGVDSERDNPNTMKAFLAAFDQRLTGLTGTKSQVKKMTRTYRPRYKKSPDGLGGYRISHPAGVFLFNSHGDLVEVAAPSESNSNLLIKLTALAEQ